MSLLKAIGGASGSVAPKLDASDVFSTYPWTGNGAPQNIVNGIDLAGQGGMVWHKGRVDATNHALVDTVRGGSNSLASDTTAIQRTDGAYGCTFNTNGITVTGGNLIINDRKEVTWTFRKAPKFFDIVTYTGDGTANRVLNHSLGQEAGIIETKATSTTGDWNTYHRSATGDLVLNTAAAQTASKTIIPSATTTTFTVNGVANTNGVTYVAYLYAHDTSADGIIQCGSSVVSGGVINVTLNWEPQFVLIKSASSGNWTIYDTMRGWATSTSSQDEYLLPNSSLAAGTTDAGNPTTTGFYINGLPNGDTYIYMAIRRPMKVPTSGTEVYSSSASSGVITSGFIVDAHFGATRAGLATNHRFHSRLQGGTKELVTSTTSAETTITDLKFDVMNGLGFSFAASEINHFFKRAKGFLDIVCYTGTGVAGTIDHNLSAVPELWLIKGRSGTTQWVWGSSLLAATEKVNMPTTAGKVTDTTSWNSTYPTSSVFSLGSSADINTSAATYIAYLFATLAGISKVGTFTGNGTTQTINCGFTTGARFILIFRTSAAGDFYIWDTVRGIVAANDPHLSLNTTAAEVTTDDSVDPEASGFIVNQVAATNINVSAATYIFLAIA